VTDFSDQVVLVTGAGAGLGRAHARLLGRSGARVVVNDLGTAPYGGGSSAGPAELVVDEIRAEGGEAVADTHSVADPDGAAAAVALAVDTFGRLDAVVNNAGIILHGGFHQQAPDDIEALLRVHLVGSVWITRAAWPIMREQRYGRVVVTSSSIGILGTPGQAAYATAKTGLVGFARALAAEGAPHGIKVNALAPMAVTRLNEEIMTEIFGDTVTQVTPERVSPVVAYLASRDCAVTGEILSAAAGRAARMMIGTGAWQRGLETPEQVRDAMGDMAPTAHARWWDGSLTDAAG
jgi:NAD(P)-dependent dehydrogenase (short-subunit alcohol dehydrogenase family)